MAGQDPRAAVQLRRRVLDVNVINAVWECAQKLNWIDSLPNQVTGVKVETELGAMIECFQRHFRSVDIKRDLRRMHFQSKSDSVLGKLIQDRIPPFSQQRKPIVDHGLRHWRKRIVEVPYTRACEAIHNSHAKLLCSPSCRLHFLNSTLVDPGRIAVTPDIPGQDRLVTLIDGIQNGLANEVGTDRMALQTQIA